MGAANDPAEREADTMAAAALRALDGGNVSVTGAGSSSRIRRREAPPDPRSTPPLDPSGTSSRIRRRAASAGDATVGPAGGALDPDTSAELNRTRGGGRPLDPNVRSRMEGAYGADFSTVRIHDDAGADRIARRIQASAFTTGRDVYFAAGQYRPDTASGMETVAHELAHVVQHGHGRVRRSVISRRMTSRPSDIDKVRSFGAKFKAQFGRAGLVKRDTLEKLRAVLSDYQRLNDPRTEEAYVDVILALCDRYLAEHAGEPVDRKISLVEDIRADAFRELGKIQAHERYLQDAYNLNGPGASPTKLQHQTMTGMTSEGAKALGKGQTSEFVMGADEESLAIAKQYHLTEAEILALRTYTAPDYKYINPATANSPGWMQAQNAGADQKQLFEEGSLHAGMAMSALMKLPKQEGTTYRGARMTPADFAQKYKVGGTIDFNAFASSAVVRSAAQKFADGLGDVKPADDQTVSVLCILDTTNARDVRNFSIFGSGEQEWMLLPGSSFKIDRVETSDKGTEGRPKATEWHVVYMSQVK